MNKEYYEIVVEGPFDLIKGFVVGFLEGRGIQGEAIFGEDHHVENEGRFGQLMRLIGIKGDRVHLIVGEGFMNILKEGIERRGHELALKIVSEKKIIQASFGFRYKAYKKDLGEQLISLFGDPPVGLSVADYESKETLLPEGKGVEAYAPLHEYEVNGSGRIYGSIKDVIGFYGTVEHRSMVELDAIKLEYSGT